MVIAHALHGGAAAGALKPAARPLRTHDHGPPRTQQHANPVWGGAHASPHNMRVRWESVCSTGLRRSAVAPHVANRTSLHQSAQADPVSYENANAIDLGFDAFLLTLMSRESGGGDRRSLLRRSVDAAQREECSTANDTRVSLSRDRAAGTHAVRQALLFFLTCKYLQVPTRHYSCTTLVRP